MGAIEPSFRAPSIRISEQSKIGVRKRRNRSNRGSQASSGKSGRSGPDTPTSDVTENRSRIESDETITSIPFPVTPDASPTNPQEQGRHRYGEPIIETNSL